MSSSSSNHRKGRDVPRYVIDLDASPEERWSEVVGDYKHLFANAKGYLQEMLGAGALESIVTGALKLLTRMNLVMFHDELEAIAAQSDGAIELGTLTALQLAYEAAACCTSIVCETPSEEDPEARELLHLRTMDWEAPFLTSMTIICDFTAGGKTAFTAVTWAGFVGVLTGVRPGAYSVSVNWRSSGQTFVTNLRRAIASSWPVGALVRIVLEEEKTFDGAADALRQSEIIAPCYLTVCGARDAGVLITRDRDGVAMEQMVVLGDEDTEPIIQTNVDQGDTDYSYDPLYSRRRLRVAKNFLGKRKGCVASVDDAWKLLKSEPITNSETIYAAVMRPVSGDIETRVIGINWKPAPLLTCSRCHGEYSEYGLPGNASGMCAHRGEWHASLSDCMNSKIACLKNAKWGYTHWSCCYAEDRTDPVCKVSPKHEE